MPKYRDWTKNPCTDDEIRKFRDKVQDMADKEFGVDDEGDSSVEVIIVDRTRYEPMHYWPVPYSHRGPKEAKAALEAVVYNDSIASEDLHRQLRGEEYRARQVQVDQVEKTYLWMLTDLPDEVRARLDTQGQLCQLRNYLARSTGRKEQDVQDEFESKASTIRRFRADRKKADQK